MTLTNEQYLTHVGGCLQKYLWEELASDGVIDSAGIRKAAVRWVTNGPIGTLAERKEAMQTLLRRVFKKLTGRTVDGTDHEYKCHFLTGAVDATIVEA